MGYSQSVPTYNNITLGTGISYTLDNENNGLYQFKERTFSVPLSLRVDLNQSISATVSTSLVSNSNTRITSSDVLSDNTSGLGDTELSFTYQSNSDPSATWPLLSFTGGVVFPTGESANSFNVGSSGTGNGARSASIGIGAVKVLSPVVLFANFGLDRSAEFEINGIKITPGQNIVFGFGFSLFVNEQITFTSRIGTTLETDLKVDGIEVSGTGSEGIPFSFGFIYTIDQVHSVAPSLNLGLSGDDDSSLSLSLSYSYNL